MDLGTIPHPLVGRPIPHLNPPDLDWTVARLMTRCQHCKANADLFLCTTCIGALHDMLGG